MYFDFYEDHPDFLMMTRDISRVEGNLHLILSILVAGFLNLAMVLLLVLLPRYVDVNADARRAQAEALLAERQQERDSARFVFMAPRVEPPPPPAVSPRAELSDRDRAAASPDRAEVPTNLLPYSRGNSPERVDVPGNTFQPTPPLERPPAPPRAQPQPASPGENGQNGQSMQPGTASPALPLPGGSQALARSGAGAAAGAPGALGESLRNLQRYVQGEAFENQGGGGGAYGPAIQFDSKGVEFGPWLRRFVAQIKRNWFIPYAAMAMKGHVVTTFFVHKDGTISELSVPGPCNVDAFNNAAFNALAASNPTQPLPPEYPSPRAFFTVTFYYNETPPYQD